MEHESLIKKLLSSKAVAADTEQVSEGTVDQTGILNFKVPLKMTGYIEPSPEFYATFQAPMEILASQAVENELVKRRYEDRIHLLEEKVARLEASLLTLSEFAAIDPDNDIENKVQLTKEQIKEYVIANVKIGEVFYPSDIANKTGADLMTVMDAITELKKEGRLSDKGE